MILQHVNEAGQCFPDFASCNAEIAKLRQESRAQTVWLEGTPPERRQVAEIALPLRIARVTAFGQESQRG